MKRLFLICLFLGLFISQANADLGLWNGRNVGDAKAPTITSATIPSAGTTIQFAMSEATRFGSGGNAGIAISSCSGGAVTLSSPSGSGTSTLTYTLSRTVYSNETGCTYTYTQPGNGWEDLSGNDVATATTQTVTNSSSQSNGTWSIVGTPTSCDGAFECQRTGVTAGNLLVAIVGEVETSPTLTASDGSSMSAATAAYGSSIVGKIARVFYRLSAVGGDTTVTVSGGAGSNAALVIYEFSKTGGTAALDTQNVNVDTGTTSISTGNITTGSGSIVTIAYSYSYALSTASGFQINGSNAAGNVRAGYMSTWHSITSSTFTGAGTCTDDGVGANANGIISFKLN